MTSREPAVDRRTLMVTTGGTILALAGCTTAGESNGDDGSSQSAPGSRVEPDTVATPSEWTATDGALGGSKPFGETMRYESAFAIDGRIQSESGVATVTARIDGNDSYWRFEREDATTELYAVDGTDYVVSGGRCVEHGDRGVLPSGLSAEKFEADRTAHADVTPSSRETVDGVAVLRYDIEADAGTVTYHVANDSGYPRRVESPTGVFTYHSWGDVAPIETPDVPCETVE
jgi:hypothetical protein